MMLVVVVMREWARRGQYLQELDLIWKQVGRKEAQQVCPLMGPWMECGQCLQVSKNEGEEGDEGH